MKLAKIATAFALLGLTASAIAGPDWDVIQRARTSANQTKTAAAKSQSPDQAMKDHCMQMPHRMSTFDAHFQSMSQAIGTHGTTSTDADAPSNRLWGNVLASVVGERNPYQDGSLIGPRDVYTDGARIGPRDVFTDGARNEQRDVCSDGALKVSGLDRTGVSAPPGHASDPYADPAGAQGVSTLE